MRLQVSQNLWRCLTVRKRVMVMVGVGVALLVLSVLYFIIPSPLQESGFYEFRLVMPRPDAHDAPAAATAIGASAFAASSDAKDGEKKEEGQLQHFKQVFGQNTFLYSAIANDREPEPGEINIIISAFDSTKTDSFRCCVLLKGDRLYTTPASVFFKQYVDDILGAVFELFKDAPTKAKQYACVVPKLGFKVTHVTLTSSSDCPVQAESYLPVVFPPVVPDGLALCAKAAFGDQLDPNKLMEWFEVQRLLGVDHIQIMDLHNPEPVQKVFRYYTQMGLLDLLPYELPGPPYGRGLGRNRVKQQVTHDETFPILDCKQRLRGYTYVMGHDMDEVLMPAKFQTVKDLMKEQLLRKPDAAGFYFYTQFFVYNWGPVTKDSDIYFFRYLNSTLPRNECKKYVYLMSRVVQARTHQFTPRGSYKEYFVPRGDAILHHYRKCPSNVWSTCNPTRMTDKSILRFRGVLEERLKLAREATGIHPNFN